jgi:hypothetical protein
MNKVLEKLKETTLSLTSGLFDLVVILFVIVFFSVCFSAYSDLEQFKKDCSNPFKKECVANVQWYGLIMVPLAFGFDLRTLRSKDINTQKQENEN